MPGSNIHRNDYSGRPLRAGPDDFARLGLGAQEARVSVIRRAATVATAAVKAKEKSAPKQCADEKLAQIAASTYRVLDPRGRVQLLERVQLTRFESAPASVPPWWKSKRVQKTSDAVKDRFDTSAVHETYVPDVGSDAEQDSIGQFISDTIEWSGLSPRDLKIACAVFSTIILLFIIVLSRGGSQEQATADPVDALSSETTLVPPPSAPSLSEPSRQDDDSEQASDVLETPEPEPSQPEEPAQKSITIPVTAPAEATPEEDNPFAEAFVVALAGESDATSNVTEPVEMLEPVVTFGPELFENANRDNVTDGDAGVPFIEPDTSVDVSISEPLTETTLTTSDQGADEEDAGQIDPLDDPRHPVPSESEIAVANERLQRLTDALPVAANDIETIENVRRLRQTAADSQPGSSDRWVLWIETIRQLVLVGRNDDAQRSMTEMMSEFQIQEFEIRNAILPLLSESADTISQKERVIGWGLDTGEQSLQRADFESAASAVRTATTLAVRLGNNDIRARLKQRSESIKQAKRMAPSVDKHVSDTLQAATSSTANLVGRYYCFYLRDWQQGLPWLAKSSNLKLAKLANTELLNSDAMSLINDWITMADDLRGRPQDSILLHARDLATRAIAISSGLEAEDLKRIRNSLDQRLPIDLRPMSPSLPAVVENQPMPLDNSKGMLGRLSADGIDVGALIQYQPGLRLTREAFSQILDQLGVKADGIQLDFVGMIDVAQDSTVQLVSGGVTVNDRLAISVDQRPVVMRRNANDRHTGTIDLAAGIHLVRWQFSGKQLDACHLLIENDRDKMPIVIRHTPELLRQVLGNSTPRLRVKILGAN